MKTPLCTTTFLLALVFILVGGCESSTDVDLVAADTHAASSQAIQFAPLGIPESARAVLAMLSPAENEVFKDSVRWASGTVGNAARAIIAKADRWQDADAGVRRRLAWHEKKTAYFAEQKAAFFMLDQVLLQGEVTLERQAAIAFYTQMLLANESPDAAIQLRAIEALQGYWSAHEVRQAASLAIRNTEAWLDQRAEAGKIGATALAGQPNREALLDVRARRTVAIQDAVEALQKLAR